MMHLDRYDDITRLTLSSVRSRVAGYGVNAWFAGGVLIDTGFPGVAADVGRAIDELRPRTVALTHWHEDHAGNAELVAARGIPIAAAPATLATLRDLPSTGIYRRVVWGRHQPLRTPTVAAELPGLDLIPTPGHSADHHVIWDAEHERVFAGDLFLGVKVRALHRSEDPRAQAASLRRVAALHPRLLLDSHRGPMPDPGPALLAKADWIEATIGEIERLIAAGWTDAAIARRVLGRPDTVTVVSFGDLSRVNFVRAVRRTANGVPAPPE